MSRPWESLPTEPGHWLTGNLAGFRTAPHYYTARLANAHGGLARFRVLHHRLLAVTDPQVIHEILCLRPDRYVRGRQYRNMQQALGRGLLSTMGAERKERRSLMNPLFRAERLRRVVPTTEAATGQLCRRWADQRRAGQPVPAVAHARWLTITVMARTLFSHDLDEPTARRLSERILRSTGLLREKNLALGNPPPWVPTRRNRQLAEVRRFLDQLLQAEMDRRQGDDAPDDDDLLGGLLALRDPQSGEPLPAEAVRDELRPLFSAGFETTAAALAWTLWRLARHPEVAARWQAEIDQLPAGEPLSPDLLKRLPYTDQVLSECLRWPPPVYIMSRVAQADDQLAGCRIPRGTIAMISLYGLHRSPALWTDPLEFRPKRFADPAVARTRMIPFEAGPHLCIGMPFALFDLKTALACLGRRYRPALAEDREIPERAAISLAPGGEIPLVLGPRWTRSRPWNRWTRPTRPPEGVGARLLRGLPPGHLQPPDPRALAVE